MERKCGNGERLTLYISSFSLHFLSISSFSHHFLLIFSFSLHFLAARLPGCHNLCNPAQIHTKRGLQHRFEHSKSIFKIGASATQLYPRSGTLSYFAAHIQRYLFPHDYSSFPHHCQLLSSCAEIALECLLPTNPPPYGSLNLNLNLFRQRKTVVLEENNFSSAQSFCHKST